MEALFVSMGVVALAEFGDKTQLLAFILAARFKRPVPIIWGILIATLANHSLAGAIGVWISKVIPQATLHWIVAISFIFIGLWTLIPDKPKSVSLEEKSPNGIFITTAVIFFLAEIGDKTQLATIVLTAHYAVPFIVIIGTTLGMLLADVPAVLIGNKFAEKTPIRLVHILAAVVFIVIGVLSLNF